MNKEIISVAIDEKTKSILDEYADKHALSRSSLIRMIVNQFFIRSENSGIK